LTNDNHLKIGDFGVSRVIGDDETTSITTMVGTFKYLSPELKELKKYSYNTDIWSAGCILFELIELKFFYDYFLSIDSNEQTSRDYFNQLKTTEILKMLLKM
jgi:serine/threonine protein kinase